jgi:metal-dependent amidase/aminoacylase/carboxypeptidase family protein
MHDIMTRWRKDFHMHPELSFEEIRTSGIVAEKLLSWGYDVETNVAKTGVVGTIRGKHSSSALPGWEDSKRLPAIGLRADM